jgi:hypothetical protein
MPVRNKQRAVIEFLTAGNVPPINTYRRMKVVYWDDSTGKVLLTVSGTTFHLLIFIGE